NGGATVDIGRPFSRLEEWLAVVPVLEPEIHEQPKMNIKKGWEDPFPLFLPSPPVAALPALSKPAPVLESLAAYVVQRKSWFSDDLMAPSLPWPVMV
ncbi:MAG: hypothetical protein V2A34_16600, partial [Lentisphaerota bacterium]